MRKHNQAWRDLRKHVMNNFPSSSYPEQNPPGGFSPGSLPTQPAFPPMQPGYAPSGGSGQPGLPTPGVYTQPGYAPPPAPRRRRTGLWITLAVILLLLVAGGGTVVYLQVR